MSLEILIEDPNEPELCIVESISGLNEISRIFRIRPKIGIIQKSAPARSVSIVLHHLILLSASCSHEARPLIDTWRMQKSNDPAPYLFQHFIEFLRHATDESVRVIDSNAMVVTANMHVRVEKSAKYKRASPKRDR
jgi:hypothetical protein